MIRFSLAAAVAAFLMAAPALADNTMAGGAAPKTAATTDCKGTSMAHNSMSGGNTMAGGNTMSGGNTMAGGNSMSSHNSMAGGAKTDCKPKASNSMSGGTMGH